MHRRDVLRLLGSASAGALLAACSGSSETGSSAPSPTPGGGRATPFDPVAQVTDAEQSLSVTAATWEQLTGTDVPLAFGVLDIDAQPITAESVEVVVVPLDGEPGEPVTAERVEDPTGRGGLYLARLDLPEPGTVSLVVTTDDDRAGSAVVPVVDAADSAFPAPGDDAPAVATPTTEDPLGAEALCTSSPPCDMHDVSLADALAEGRPVVLQFATPAYCQTAVCGPSVEVLDAVRSEGDWGDVVFVHSEIYADAGQTLLEPVAEFGLPSEPWLYAIDGEGVVVRRVDGPLLTLADHVRDVVTSVA